MHAQWRVEEWKWVKGSIFIWPPQARGRTFCWVTVLQASRASLLSLQVTVTLVIICGYKWKLLLLLLLFLLFVFSIDQACECRFETRQEEKRRDESSQVANQSVLSFSSRVRRRRRRRRRKRRTFNMPWNSRSLKMARWRQRKRAQERERETKIWHFFLPAKTMRLAHSLLPQHFIEHTAREKEEERKTRLLGRPVFFLLQNDFYSRRFVLSWLLVLAVHRMHKKREEVCKVTWLFLSPGAERRRGERRWTRSSLGVSVNTLARSFNVIHE